MPACGGCRPDLLDVLEVIIRDAVEHLELVVGNQHRRVAVLLARSISAIRP